MNDRYIVYFMSKTKKKMKQFIRAKLKEHHVDDLDPSYGNILTVLYQNDGELTMNQIAKQIGKDKSTVTSHVKRLVSAGYIKKIKSDVDHRVTTIQLTNKGWNFQGTYSIISHQLYEQAYQGITYEEKEQFLNTLKKINNNFNK